MPETCDVCASILDEYGKCKKCDSIKHIDGAVPNDEPGADVDILKRTRPVRGNLELLKNTPAEDDNQISDDEEEIDPENLKIDFDKVDSSLLFDEDLEDEKITSKMLPLSQKPKDTVKKPREIKEAPSEEALRRKEVYGLRDIGDGDIQESKAVSYRTKVSMTKRKGSSLVLIIALVIILIIIISLWLFGFLDFAVGG